jgi:N-acetylglucosamine kinase-like BadF-type ATPase
MRYILGFDGGGTKTECVLMNSADQVLARTYAGPSNPSRIGVESAVRAIEESANLALRDAGLERSAISGWGGPCRYGQARHERSDELRVTKMLPWRGDNHPD